MCGTYGFSDLLTSFTLCLYTKYNNSSEEDGSISHAPDDYISRRFASGLLVRDYPPKSELIASMRSRHLSVRLLFRGKVVSRASAKELVSYRGHQCRL